MEALKENHIKNAGDDAAAQLAFDYSTPKTLLLKLSGVWQITAALPEAGAVGAQLAGRKEIVRLAFDLSGVTRWDSGLISFLWRLSHECQRRHINFAQADLPPAVRKLLETASSAMSAEITPVARHDYLLEIIEMTGGKALGLYSNTRALIDFLGEIVLAFGRLFRGKACFRRSEFVYILQSCGVDALGLVSLISVLVGVIFAFVGAIQLQMFGAQIFVAHIVGIAMVRVMGAIMAGILMAGRTGASFAAELGIMQTNEEIDALKTMGVNPIDFLVVPRILALIIMLPLLTIYADIMGILGGLVISAAVLDINPLEYWHHTQMAVKLSNLWIGLINSLVFGVIVAVAGCFHGMKCERSAAGVGEATTSAVVSAITSIVIATAVITFICQILGIK